MESKHALIALAALAQDTRLRIFRLLIEAGPSGRVVGEIGHELAISPATLSFHLKELTRAELITARQAGRFIHYAANFGCMNALIEFLTENCCARQAADCCATDAACAPATSAANRVAG